MERVPGALNVGLVGCGFIAQAVHLPALSRLPGVRVAALAEPEARRLEQARRLAPEAAACADYRELLQRHDVQAVVVSLPPTLQAEAGIATLAAGKHLYLEKPMATELAAADRLLAAWRRSDLQVMIGFNYRFHPLHVDVRREIEHGRVGEPIAARSIFSSGRGALQEWKRTRRTGGGALLSLGSHHFDLLPYLLGASVREVRANVRSVATEDDCAAVTMRLDNGVVVQSLFHIGLQSEDRIEVYGRAGTLVADRLHSLCPEVADGAAPASLLRDDALAPAREPSYEPALRHFVDCVRAGRPPSPSLWDGRRSLGIVLAAEESARTGRPLAVPELRDEDPAD
jgi:myo-inositol 2-dehydrogenase/D-chiro-inositol 1-dehydrogenase